MNTKSKISSEISPEIWVKIFGYLDFKSLQRIATCVCKRWFEIIRNDTTLSGKLTLTCRSSSEINSILGKWKKLKILHLPDFYGNYTKEQGEYLKQRFENKFAKDDLKDVDMKCCVSLEKVIIRHNFEGMYLTKSTA